jgi:hypothetical protein
MPRLAINRKDTGGESIGSLSPSAADLASTDGKRSHCGGIVAGAGFAHRRLTQSWPRFVEAAVHIAS